MTAGRCSVKGRGTPRLERLLGRGLLTNDGASHLRQRRRVLPAVHRERLAGHETTAMALTWTWWLLAQHPAIEAQLDAELATVPGGRTPGIDDVPALRFTRDVIAESMRLYPPAWVVGRRAIEDAPSVRGRYRKAAS